MGGGGGSIRRILGAENRCGDGGILGGGNGWGNRGILGEGNRWGWGRY